MRFKPVVVLELNASPQRGDTESRGDGGRNAWLNAALDEMSITGRTSAEDRRWKIAARADIIRPPPLLIIRSLTRLVQLCGCGNVAREGETCKIAVFSRIQEKLNEEKGRKRWTIEDRQEGYRAGYSTFSVYP